MIMDGFQHCSLFQIIFLGFTALFTSENAQTIKFVRFNMFLLLKIF